MGVLSVDVEDDCFAYRYDTQLLIDRRDKDLDEDEIADYITEHIEGNSLIAAGDEDLVKIHFNSLEDARPVYVSYGARLRSTSNHAHICKRPR